MNADGTFELSAGGAGFVGRGNIEVQAEGIQLSGRLQRKTLAVILAAMVSLIAITLATIVAFVVLDHLHLVSTRPLRAFVAVGAVVGVVSGLGSHALFLRYLPTRSATVRMYYRYVLQPRATTDVLYLTSTVPGYVGQIVFRTANSRAMAAAIESGRQRQL